MKPINCSWFSLANKKESGYGLKPQAIEFPKNQLGFVHFGLKPKPKNWTWNHFMGWAKATTLLIELSFQN